MLWVRLCVLWVCSAGLLSSAIANVQVVGSTNVQALLKYDSSVDESCTVEVSESSDFRPLVHDVNPELFPGADQDSRPGNPNDGRSRMFLAGKRAVDQATDRKWYSRALQAHTTHYYRIRCGGDTATGSFRTANLPVGVTYPWPIPQDPNTGNFRWPSTDNNDRNQKIVDPSYGTLIRRVSVPGDMPADFNADVKSLRLRLASGVNWGNPADALNGPGATNPAASADWLVLTNPDLWMLTDYYVGAVGLDYITVRITGSARGATPEERTIDVCLTLDGANCHGEVRSAALSADGGTVSLGSSKPIDTWGEAVWMDSIYRNEKFGIMIRKHTPLEAGVTIQSAELELSASDRLQSSNGGFVQTCAPVKSNGGFHCSFPSAGSSNHMFWINPESGEVRFLGKLTASGWGGPNTVCSSGFALFDTTDPNIYYCAGNSNGKLVLLKGTYTGGDQAAEPGSRVKMDWINLTPEPNTISDLIRSFNPEFDPALFPCSLNYITGQHVILNCRRRGQDSIGWIVAYDLANRGQAGTPEGGRIAAASKSFASPNTRWCGIHTLQTVGHINWIGWSATSLWGGGPGLGPYTVTLQGDVPGVDGRMVINVSGEPLIGNDPNTFLMESRPGDVFRFSDPEGRVDFVRILSKMGPTTWEIERILPRGGSPPPRAAGTSLMAICNAQNLSTPGVAPDAYWSFLEDPHGQDATNTKTVAERILTGGHVVERGNYRVMAHYEGYQVITPGIPSSFNQPPSYRIPSNPRWAGVRAFTALNADGLGNIYQQHPSFENYQATEPGRNNWFTDLLPFAGTPGLTRSIEPVPGFSQVYRALGTTLNRETFPTFARCGGTQLKEMFGPITDADRYSFCVGGNCVPGAGSSDVFVNCPAPVSADRAPDGGSVSRCSENPAGDSRSVCVSDMTPYGQSITQFFFDPSGQRNRVLTNGLFAWHSPRTYMSLDTASSLPDGSWIVFPSFGNNARKDIYMVKVPPQPPFEQASSEPSHPVPVNVSAAPPAGTQDVVFRFGSDGNVSRSSSPVSCGGSPCDATIWSRPPEFLFSKPVFRDSAGQTIGEGKVDVRLTGGMTGSGLGKPQLSGPAAIVNSASLEQPIAPGSAVSIFGEGLAECYAQASSFPLPTKLCEAFVTFNGQPAYLFSADRGRIDALLPSSLAPGQNVEVSIERSGTKSDPVTIPGSSVLEAAPAVNTYYLDGTLRYALLRNSDLSLNGPDRPEINIRPLKLGESATLYANALGPVTPPVPDGEAAPAEPQSSVLAIVELYINGVRQSTSFAGLSPGSSGLYMMKFTLDPSTPIIGDDKDQIWIKVKDVESPRATVRLTP